MRFILLSAVIAVFALSRDGLPFTAPTTPLQRGDNYDNSTGITNGAVIQSFSAGSMIIPMDGCYQRMEGMSSDSDFQDIFGSTFDTSASVCNSSEDDGVLRVYGMVSRLVRGGVPVHWIVGSAKTNLHEIDFSVSGTNPVDHYDPSSGSQTSPYSGLSQIDYRGAPFVIDVGDSDGDGTGDVAEAKTLLAGSSFSGFPDLDEVDIHIANVDFSAPVLSTIEQMPKLAVVDMTTDSNFKSTSSTGEVIDYLPDQGGFEASGTWWDVVSVDDVLNDTLTDDGYSIVWVPGFTVSGSTAPTTVQNFVGKLALFADAGGTVVAFDGAVSTIEGNGHATGGGDFSSDQDPVYSFHADEGVIQGGHWKECGSGIDGYTLTSNASAPICQWGGDCWTPSASATTPSWIDREDPVITTSGDQRAFYSGVVGCAITANTSDGTSVDSDDSGYMMASYRYKDNDPTKGKIVYIGAHNWKGTKPTGLRIIFNTVYDASIGLGSTTFEVSRSAPVVAEVGSANTQFQASIEVSIPPETLTTFTGSASASTFEFPQYKGHFRAIDLDSSSFTGDEFLSSYACDGSDACLYDTSFPSADTSGSCLPSGTVSGQFGPLDASCRAIFTNTTSGQNPDVVAVATPNVNGEVLDSLLDPSSSLTGSELETLVERIVAGADDGSGGYEPALGGVDYSSVAVIEESTHVPFDALSSVSGRSRPTMAYFGALDGMLHAVCLESLGSCTAGEELWAFMPRTQLSLVAGNEQRIDGSPKVADVFGDFGTFDSDGTFSSTSTDGRSEFRTVLVFQTGTDVPGATEAVYGLDISDPFNPRVLWETTDDSNSEGFGAGLTVALGAADTSAGQSFLAFVQTNKSATGDNGFKVAALDAVTGSPAWTFDYDYVATRGGTLPPDTGVPGGVSVFDATGLGTVDTVLVPSLYGEMWVLDAGDGTSKFDDGSGNDIPILRMSSDLLPIGAVPAVFSDGLSFYGVVGTGGYVDYLTPITGWSDSSQQYVMSVKLSATPPSGVPFDETDTSGAVVARKLGSGERVFAQATIAGDQIIALSDTEDINSASYGNPTSSGRLYGYGSVSSSSALSNANGIVVAGGASSADLDKANNKIHVGSSRKVQEKTASGIDFSGGTAVEAGAQNNSRRRLWLRTE